MALGAAFTCNICGQASRFEPVDDWREEPTCRACGSSVRMRSIVHCLLQELLGRSRVLAGHPRRRLIGAGLSDWDGYATRLAEVFDYTNTYYHQSPRLDICAPGAERLGLYDFLIASDVFEHVPAPVDRAFAGAFSILRPGGVLVLTVPFGDAPGTVEHYPGVERYAVVELGGRHVVVTQGAEVGYALDIEPCFHGGPGSTLEMRLFGIADLVAGLERAGFEDIHLHDQPAPAWGVFPRSHHGVPVTARKPASPAQKLKNAVRKARPAGTRSA